MTDDQVTRIVAVLKLIFYALCALVGSTIVS